MEKYTIAYVPVSPEDMPQNAADIGNPFENNRSIYACIAMILNKDINEVKRKKPHYHLYGKYLGGFLFESIDLLPPLCILNSVLNNIPHNAVYYNRTVYDPILGVFAADDYIKHIQIKTYIQIFIEEAYEGTDWHPFIPEEIGDFLEKDAALRDFFLSLPSIRQSIILNRIRPFSKENSFKEKRSGTALLNAKQTDAVISHIRDLQQARSDSNRSVWDELRDFETVEAPEMLRKCGLETGMTVLDLGCGHAHYTIPASLAAGKEGRVIAVDISKKSIREAEKRTSGLNAAEIIFMNTDENGLTEYAGRIDFLMVYDVLHGAEWKDNKDEKIKKLHSLLKERSILSLALYSEIERKPDPLKNPTAKGSVSTVAISHEEAIKPYIEMIESCGFRLHTVVYNGGVHFDNFHSPYHWRKYGEVRITSLERRPVYNFIKE